MTISFELPVPLPLTATDYEALQAPEGVRLELSEGTLEMAAAAQMMWHSQIARRISVMFESAGRTAAQETGVVLAPRTVRAPDVSRFRPGAAPNLRASQFPATDVDLVVEIVSPESGRRDRVTKPTEYARAGIPEFWLVEEDPESPAGAIVSIFQLTLHPTGQEYVLLRRVSLDDLAREAD